MFSYSFFILVETSPAVPMVRFFIMSRMRSEVELEVMCSRASATMRIWFHTRFMLYKPFPLSTIWTSSLMVCGSFANTAVASVLETV